MKFRITVRNGEYPLTYECATAHKAYGCMVALAGGLLSHIPIDLDEIMAVIIDIKHGGTLSFSANFYGIEAIKEEAPQ